MVAGQSKMVTIETEKQLNDSLMKAQGSEFDFLIFFLFLFWYYGDFWAIFCIKLNYFWFPFFYHFLIAIYFHV